MSEDEWNKVETDLWKPEKDDEVSGVYIGVQHEVGVNNSNLYTIESKGKQIGFWGSIVLDGKMIGVKFGQELKVVFLGLVKPDKGNEYKDYEIFTKPMKE